MEDLVRLVVPEGAVDAFGDVDDGVRSCEVRDACYGYLACRARVSVGVIGSLRRWLARICGGGRFSFGRPRETLRVVLLSRVYAGSRGLLRVS